jgi:predicted house-cleaning noncanonical NTP pyrophosphatase (MazG superfamily)
MHIHYNKLVRDAIPAIIERQGKTCHTSTPPEIDYQLALREKLLEEAGEARDAPLDQLKEELADLYELLDALASAYGWSEAEVRQIQMEKRMERGGFERRVFLEWVED